MTVYCERDTQKPGNVCVKCNGTWTAGTPLPACSAMGAGAATTAKKEMSDEMIQGLTATSDRFISERDLSFEPTFTLYASDLLAGYLVEEWARKAEQHGCDPKRVRAAREKAQEFRAWAGERGYPQ